MTKTRDTRQMHEPRRARDASAARYRARTIGAAICVLALGGAALTGCGGHAPADADPATVSVGQTPADQSPKKQAPDEESSNDRAPDSADAASREELPEGFPADVPLPGFTKAHKTGGSADDGYWVVVLELTSSTDTPVEDYAAQLTDAGYTVDDGSGGKEASNDTWDVSFHSALGRTLTVSVIGN